MKATMFFSEQLGELVIPNEPEIKLEMPEDNMRRRDELIRNYSKTGNAVSIVRLIGGSTADFNIK